MLEIATVTRAEETPAARLRRKVLGWTLFALGAGIVVLFSISVVYELMSGTVFGLGICLFVITFGLLILREAAVILWGLRVQLIPTEAELRAAAEQAEREGRDRP